MAKFADSPSEFNAAQRLRYQVFIKELGGNGALVDHENGLERDEFDPFFHHLLLYDMALEGELSDKAIGVYRVLTSDRAKEFGRFYSEDEYDLSPLKNTGRKLLELGRSCISPRYRGGSAMYYLWQALSKYVIENEIEVLFGIASFPGTDIHAFKESLSLLYHHHLAPKELRVVAKSPFNQKMDLIEKQSIDRKRAMVAVPALIKAYIRLGGVVGDGAYIDHAFNTTDICLILDTNRLNLRQKQIYAAPESLQL